jgi:hypothetical protein
VKHLAVALLSCVALAALAPGSSRADSAFSDPVGDGVNTPALIAPDISSVAVSSSPQGLVTFTITIANYQSLPLLSGVAIGLDLDRNRATGDDGTEAFIGYLVGLFGQRGLAFDRWNGTELAEVEPTTATAAFSNGVVTLTVPRAELLDTTSFDFQAAGIMTDLEDVAYDFAPDDGWWSYELAVAPVTLTAASPAGVPASPRAGRPFVVTTVVTRSDTSGPLADAAVTCTARVGKVRVRALARFRAGRAECAMTLPRTASGGTLRGSITVRAAGSSVVRPFSFRVR